MAYQTSQGLASLGRNGDSVLVHMNPTEVAGLQGLAMSQGGSLTINPHTGLPEAFSPNGDGNNDFFRPTPYPTTNVEILGFEIFNRWGQLVYKAEDQQDAVDGWDGNYNGAPQPRDIYIFVFSYRIPGDPTIYTIRGQVTLFR